MLECHACFRRYLNAIAVPHSSPSPLRLSPRTTIFVGRLQHGRSASSLAVEEAPQSYDKVAIHGKGSPLETSGHGKFGLALTMQRAAGKRLPQKLRHKSSSKEADEENKKLERVAKEELRWLQDPLRLSERVRAVLPRKGGTKPVLAETKAFALVRVASKSMDCVVAWNHIIDHYMAQGKPKLAQKTFNEMKKRAQFPDSHTYTIMLRGFAAHSHNRTAVPSALSIYHSLFGPSSRVKPNVIHTNAALNVCARQNDMDALWGITSRIPSKGPGAADNTTFTIILNALRQNVLADADNADEAVVAEGKEKAVVHGRRLWADVLFRWTQGDLQIDEKLVCAMGRLLMIGRRARDQDDVLSLVEQTMNIPRLCPRLGVQALPSPVRGKQEHPSESDDPFGLQLEPMPNGGSSGPRKSLSYATPGPATLSLIMEACRSIGARRPATAYWELLTDPQCHSIRADQANKHAYLRILRQARAAHDAVDFVRDEMSGQPHMAKTYRIAMSTCLRASSVARIGDAAATRAANDLFEVMAQRLPILDAVALAQYVEILKATNDMPSLLRGIDLLVTGDGKIQRLETLLRHAQTQDERLKARELFGNMIGILDGAVQKGVSEDLVKSFRVVKNRLASMKDKGREEDERAMRRTAEELAPLHEDWD